MTRNRIVRNADSDPVSPFATGTFSNQVHDPYLVRVTDGERFAFGSVAVLVDECDHPLDGFASRLTALQRDVDETAVVDTHRVPEGLTTTPGCLTDGHLVLVGVTYDRIGVCYLRDLPLFTTGVPVFDSAHRSFGIVRSGSKMQKTVHAVRVRCVRYHCTTVHRSLFADEEVGTCLYRRKVIGERREEQQSC